MCLGTEVVNDIKKSLMEHFANSCRSVSSIPAPLALPIFVAIYECRMVPPTGWKKEAYLLIGELSLCLGFRLVSPRSLLHLPRNLVSKVLGLTSKSSETLWSAVQFILTVFYSKWDELQEESWTP